MFSLNFLANFLVFLDKYVALQDIDYICLLSGRNRLLVDWEATILMLSCA